MTSAGLNIVSFVRNLKYLYIVFSADLDSIITSSMLMRVAREEGVEVYLAPFYAVSMPIDSGSTVILVKVLQRAPVGNVKVIQVDDLVGKDPKVIASTAIYLLKEIKKHIVMPRFIDVLALVSMLSINRGSVHDENVIDVHKQLLDEAIDKDIYMFIDSLKLFGYPKRDIVESLMKTVDPYIYGVSLDLDGSRKLLESLGGNISNEEVKMRLINEISSRLSSYCRTCSLILGRKIVLKDAILFDDPYEAVYILSNYVDVMGPEPLLYACMDSRVVEVAKGVYEYTLKRVKEVVDQVIAKGDVRRVIVKGVRLSIVDISSAGPGTPLYVIHRILRALGLAEDITVFSNGREYILPLQFVAPRWPYDKELHIEKGRVVFDNIQAVGEVFK